MEAVARPDQPGQFLYQFPLGVFAIALATAIFPSLSSEALDGDREKFRSVLRTGIEASLWEGIPASVGLVLVAGPAIRLLFQHGRVTEHDAALIQSSLLFYAGGIWAFSLLQIVNRAYYAVHDTVTPLVMSVANIAINLAVEIPLLVAGEPPWRWARVSFATKPLDFDVERRMVRRAGSLRSRWEDPVATRSGSPCWR